MAEWVSLQPPLPLLGIFREKFLHSCRFSPSFKCQPFVKSSRLVEASRPNHRRAHAHVSAALSRFPHRHTLVLDARHSTQQVGFDQESL